MVASAVVEFRQNGYSTRYPTTPIRVPRAHEQLFRDVTATYRKLHEQDEIAELIEGLSQFIYNFRNRQGERVTLSPQELEALEQQRLEEEARKLQEIEETRQRLDEEQRQLAIAEASLAAMREQLLLEEAARIEAEREHLRLEQEREESARCEAEARALAEREAAARREAELELQRLEQEKEEVAKQQAEAVELAEARARQEKEATVAEAQSLAAKEAATRSQLEVTVQELQEQLNAVRLEFTEKNILLEQQGAELKELKELLGIADQDIADLKRENAELRSQLATKNAPPTQTPPSQQGLGKPK